VLLVADIDILVLLVADIDINESTEFHHTPE